MSTTFASSPASASYIDLNSDSTDATPDYFMNIQLPENMSVKVQEHVANILDREPHEFLGFTD